MLGDSRWVSAKFTPCLGQGYCCNTVTLAEVFRGVASGIYHCGPNPACALASSLKGGCSNNISRLQGTSALMLEHRSHTASWTQIRHLDNTWKAPCVALTAHLKGASEVGDHKLVEPCLNAVVLARYHHPVWSGVPLDGRQAGCMGQAVQVGEPPDPCRTVCDLLLAKNTHVIFNQLCWDA